MAVAILTGWTVESSATNSDTIVPPEEASFLSSSAVMDLEAAGRSSSGWIVQPIRHHTPLGADQ